MEEQTKTHTKRLKNYKIKYKKKTFKKLYNLMIMMAVNHYYVDNYYYVSSVFFSGGRI